MNGADYIATTELVVYKPAKRVVAAAGETCERVPEVSLPWLIEQGIIVPKPAEGESNG